VLKSFFSTPFSFKYLAAGELTEIAPAGLMWSVVIKSPRLRRQKASLIGWIGFGFNYVV
jgi:hypothetical protein